MRAGSVRCDAFGLSRKSFLRDRILPRVALNLSSLIGVFLSGKLSCGPKGRPKSVVICCTLAENAFDYLVLAGEQASSYTPRMLKHALATLADGVELLLKAPPEKKDWKLP